MIDSILLGMDLPAFLEPDTDKAITEARFAIDKALAEISASIPSLIKIPSIASWVGESFSFSSEDGGFLTIAARIRNGALRS